MDNNASNGLFMKSKLIRVGIAGFGVVGRRRRQFIDSHPDMEVVAVCDATFGGKKCSDHGLVYHERYQALVRENLDAIFVCLPNYMAPQATIAGLNSGLHVFCEKPPGRTLSDVAQVIECERNHPDLRLKYGFNHRYHESIRAALKLIHSKELGSVINIRGVYGKSEMLSFDSSWRTKREFAGGGILLDQGIHMVDLMRLFVGEFTEIHSVVSNDFWHHDVEDNAYALMRTSEGVVGILHSSATQWRHLFQMDITLTKGQIRLSGILSGSKSYGDETMTVSCVNKDGRNNPLEKTTRYKEDSSWMDEIIDFADIITTERKVTEGSSGDALKTLQLVYRIYCADQNWKTKFDLTDALPEGFEL